MNEIIHKLTKEELTTLERDFGPLCAETAAERTETETREGLAQYRDEYNTLFEQIVIAALHFRSTGGGEIDSPQFSTNFVRSLLNPETKVEEEEFDLKSPFNINEEEFHMLDKAFGLLCHDAAWKVLKVYRHEEQENIVQELFIAMLRSASQYKRKFYFQQAFDYLRSKGLEKSPMIVCWEDSFSKHKLTRSEEWDFLSFMDNLPEDESKPSPRTPLVLDESASRYIKTCIWNQQKSELKSLGKDSRIKKTDISLSENDGWMDIESQIVSSHEEPASPLRDELFEGVRRTLQERDQRAARTYNILTDPKNEEEVFPKTSDYKLKINGVRKRTNQSYKSIRSDLETIKEVMDKELVKHRRRLAETK